MKNSREIRSDVRDVESLRQLVEVALPLGLGSPRAERTFFRDVYLDTADGQLRQRGITCRHRGREHRQQLTLFLPGAAADGQITRHDQDVQETDAIRAAAGASAPARLLREFIDPALLEIAFAVHTERFVRLSERRLLQFAQFQFAYDIASIERDGVVRDFLEIRVRRLRGGLPRLARISAALEESHGLRPLLASRLERERNTADSLSREAERRSVGTGAIALIVVDRGTIACLSHRGVLRLPVADGNGEGACRHLLRERFGSTVGDLHRIGRVPIDDGAEQLEIWLTRHIRQGRQPSMNAGTVLWLSLEELIARVGTGALRDRHTLAALFVAARSDLMTSAEIAIADSPPAVGVAPVSVADDREDGADHQLLDADRSLLEFNSRVLAMAEDPGVPLLERLQYLAIVSANNDEFYSVRVSAIKRSSTATSGEHRIADAADRLSELTRIARLLGARQSMAFHACFRELAAHGVHLLAFDHLEPGEQAQLRKHFSDVVFPALTPKAVTEAPGFPLPNIASLVVTFAVLVKDPQTGPLHLSFVRIPSIIPRLLPVRDGHSFVLLDDLINDQVDTLFPGRAVLQAHVFRVTRGGEMDADEAYAGDFLQSIDEDAKRRASNAIVRVEVERTMPQSLRARLLGELRFDTGGEPLPLTLDEVHEVDGPLDLGLLRPIASLPIAALRFPPLRPREPFSRDRSIFSAIREHDRLVHHPYDDFASSVQRFIEEAADDPDVSSLKVTLYRAGERSGIVDALIRAAQSGKDVSAFVELKARFDEARNVIWARRLGDAGVHVVYGLVGLKNHAKMSLVVRREADALRRYVHIGTGNYNAGTARFYTDLGLFSADDQLTADVNDLFNELTGSSHWPRGTYRQLLVAPHAMLPALLALVEREIAHAAAGRPSGIRLKLNGLSDVELIDALYRASQAGVEIDLIVRGLCRLSPGIPALSERIRVFSILGRFLEHARIYAFTNGGAAEYFIGSADWRARNVRRRVEAVTPVRDEECRAKLDAILRRELGDESAWQLSSDGSYRRRSQAPDAHSVAQNAFAAELPSAELAPA